MQNQFETVILKPQKVQRLNGARFHGSTAQDRVNGTFFERESYLAYCELLIGYVQ